MNPQQNHQSAPTVALSDGPQDQEPGSREPQDQEPQAQAPQGRLKHWRKLLHSIAAERASPVEMGLAVALGVWVGTLPFFGFHALITIGLATVFRLNRIIAVVASNYSMPPLIPFIVYGSVQLGHYILHGRAAQHSLDTLRDIDPGAVFMEWTLGGAILGAGLGAMLGGVAFGLATLKGRRAPAAS